jgi:hypothetical protein
MPLDMEWYLVEEECLDYYEIQAGMLEIVI